MKKLIPLILIAALALSGCRVGPEEKPHDPLVSPDVNSLPDLGEPPTTTLSDDDTVDFPATDAPDPDVTTEPDDEPDITEPAVTEPPEPDPEPITTPDIEYDVDFYDTPETMYSTISLNVRSGPSVDFKSIGALREGQEAKVIGKATTGWYLIEFNGELGYVSGSYMTDKDPNPAHASDPIPDPDLGHTQIGPTDNTSASIIEDYAVFAGTDPENVKIAANYGSYDAGEAVVMILTDRAYTDDMYYFTVAGYDFELSSGGLRIHIHRPDGSFIELSDAYDQGLLTADDVAKIHEKSGGPKRETF